MAPGKAAQGLLWHAMRPQQEWAFQRFFSTSQRKRENILVRRPVGRLQIRRHPSKSRTTSETSPDAAPPASTPNPVQDHADRLKTLDQPPALFSHPFLSQHVGTHPGMHVRNLMRRVPHPVAVITSNMAPYTSPDSYRGMTVSSFNTVTLEPSTIVSFNVKRPSSTYDAMKASGRFEVHVLEGSSHGAAIAERFSLGNGKDAFLEAEQLQGKPEALFLAGSNSTPGGRHRPVIISDHVMFALNCELLPESVEIGDHVVVLGRVVNHSHVPDRRVDRVRTLGLVYVNRCYRKPGKTFASPTNPGPGISAGYPSDKVRPSISGAPSFADLPQEHEKESHDTLPRNTTSYRLVSGPLSEAGARMFDRTENYRKKIQSGIKGPATANKVEELGEFLQNTPEWTPVK